MKLRMKDLPGGPFAPLLYLIAIIVMPLKEAAEWLMDKAYHGWVGIFWGIVSFFVAVGGGIFAGNYVGWQLGWSIWAWLPAGILGWVAVFFYLFPIAYLVIIKPVWDAMEAMWRGIRRLAKQHFKSITHGFIALLNTVCIGSRIPWNAVMKREKRSWLTETIEGLSWPAIFLGTGYLGYNIYGTVAAWAAATFGIGTLVAAVAGAAVGIFVFTLALGFLWGFLEYGRQPFVAIATGIIMTVVCAPQIAALVAMTGLTAGAAVVAGYVVAFLAWTAYIYPTVNVLLSDGLKLFVEKVKPLINRVYDSKKEDEQGWKFLWHVVNFPIAVGLGYLAFYLVGLMSLGTAVAWSAAAVVGILSYLLVVETVEETGENILFGLASSAGLAWLSYSAYTGAGLWFGVYGGIGAAIVAAFFTFMLVFPLLWLFLFKVSTVTHLASLGKYLDGLHELAYDKGFKKLMKKIEDMAESCYEDGNRHDSSESDKNYRKFFLHATNVKIAVAAVLVSPAWLATYIGSGAVGVFLTWLLVAVGTALCYLLVGKLLLSWKYGTGFIGFVSGLAGGFYASSWVHSAQPFGYWVSLPVFFAAGFLAYVVLFPLLYHVVKAIANPLLAGWLGPILSGLYDFFWARFEGLWNAFVKVYEIVRDFFAPWWAAFVRVYRRVAKAIGDIWDSMTGRSGA